MRTIGIIEDKKKKKPNSGKEPENGNKQPKSTEAPENGIEDLESAEKE
jgi:hypothetical protein